MDAGTRAVLEQRARALARPVAAPVAGDTVELITFVLADELCAVEARYVVEVLRLGGLALLPGAEPPLLGVTVWRGGLLNIVDLRALLGISVAAPHDAGMVVVLGETAAAFGILVDAVRDLVTLPLAQVREPPDGVAVKRDYLRGVTGDALLVMDAAKLLQLHA
jgi:purine-binding chemotaxis protein CheW